MKRRAVTGSPEELRAKAAKCAARALAWLKRGAELERAARRQERKREALFPWPCNRCRSLYGSKAELAAHDCKPVADAG